jgi:hypothetical protein
LLADDARMPLPQNQAAGGAGVDALRHCPFDEPIGKRLGQRRDGELLLVVED